MSAITANYGDFKLIVSEKQVLLLLVLGIS